MTKDRKFILSSYHFSFQINHVLKGWKGTLRTFYFFMRIIIIMTLEKRQTSGTAFGWFWLLFTYKTDLFFSCVTLKILSKLIATCSLKAFK